jgi:hypothetical protein
MGFQNIFGTAFYSEPEIEIEFLKKDRDIAVKF